MDEAEALSLLEQQKDLVAWRQAASEVEERHERLLDVVAQRRSAADISQAEAEHQVAQRVFEVDTLNEEQHAVQGIHAVVCESAVVLQPLVGYWLVLHSRCHPLNLELEESVIWERLVWKFGHHE